MEGIIGKPNLLSPTDSLTISLIIGESMTELKNRGVKQFSLWQFTDEFDFNRVLSRAEIDPHQVFRVESFRIGKGAEIYVRMKPEDAKDASGEIFVGAPVFFAGIDSGSVIKVEGERNSLN